MPDGKATQKTLYGKRESGESNAPRPPLSFGGQDTKPGKERIRTDIHLSRYYDFSCEGTYTIIVKQSLLQDGDNKEPLKATSNKLKITVNNSLDVNTGP